MMPHSEAAEKSLVGRLVLDPSQLPILAGSLRPEDFFLNEYGSVYRAMLELSAEGKDVDYVTLSHRMGEDAVYQLDLPTGARGDIQEYATIIREHAKRRIAMSVLDRAYRTAEAGEGDVMVVLQDAFQTLARGADENNLIAPNAVVEGYLRLLQQRESGDEAGLTWGIPGLDEKLHPATGTEVTVLAARPGVGKTAMAENIVDHWATQKKGPILFASLEMSINQLVDRAIARRSGIDANLIVRGKLDPTGFSTARMAAEERRNVNVWYVNNGWLTTAGLRSAAAKLKMLNDGGLGAIVVDYMQLLKDKQGGDSEVNRVSHISHNLKAIAQEFDVPVLGVAQLSRAGADVDPQMHHLRDSGALEQDADNIVMLGRREGTPTMKVFIRKQRQGSPGVLQLDFNGARQVFSLPEPNFVAIPSWG